MKGKEIPETIVVYEPQCRGFEHSAFNAALIASFMEGFPDCRVVLIGDEEHLHFVAESILFSAGQKYIDRLTTRPIDLPPWMGESWVRLRHDFKIMAIVSEVLREVRASLLCVSSLTGVSLLNLKIGLWFRRVRVPVFAIPHAILDTLLRKESTSKLGWLISFRFVLKLPTPAHLVYLALSPGILNMLQRSFPSIASRFRAIDIPYFMEERESNVLSEAPNPIRFGFVGLSYKGLSEFDKIARVLSSSFGQNVEFLMVGFVNMRKDLQGLSDVIQGVSDQALSLEEIQKRLGSLTYPVCVYPRENYHLRASTSFLDALSSGRPGIFIRTPFVEYYYREMGDIGYLCDSPEQIEAVMRDILREFPTERYKSQVTNIKEGRWRFVPQSVGKTLAALMETHS